MQPHEPPAQRRPWPALVQRLRDFVKAGNPWVQLRVLLLLGLGWLLSPLCWWNDLVINLPLAYGVGLLVKQFNPEWFTGGLIAGYWLSNVAGIVLMQTSALEVFQEPGKASNLKRELLWGLFTSTIYTLLVFGLVQVGLIQTPVPELVSLKGAELALLAP
jgi:hypothetical protein